VAEIAELIQEQQPDIIPAPVDRRRDVVITKLDPLIPCFRCGVCCTRHQVRVNVVEARRICDGLGLRWHEFLRDYADPRWPGADSFVLRQQDEVCVFLKNTNIPYQKICLIHMFKPSACREWTPSLYRRECHKGLLRYWELTVSSEGELQGDDKRILGFQHFLESLTAGNDLQVCKV